MPLMRTKPMWQATAWSCVAWKLLDVIWSYDLIRPDTTCVSFVRVLHGIAMCCLLFNLNILPLAKKHKSCSQNYGNTLPNRKQNLKATLGLKVAGNLQLPCWILASKSRVFVSMRQATHGKTPQILVFGCALPSAPPASSCLLPPPAHTQLTHTQLTTYSHTQPSYTQSSLTHNLFTHNLFTQLAHTHTTPSHTTPSHTQLTHTQLFHTQLTHTQLVHTQLTGRRGTWRHRHRPSLCVAGMALMALGWLWWHAWSAGDAAVFLRGWRAIWCGRRGTWWHPVSFGVAGVALGDIDLAFAWQATRLWHWAVSCDVLGPCCCLSPRWPGVQDDTTLCAWGQRSVSNRIWQTARAMG